MKQFVIELKNFSNFLENIEKAADTGCCGVWCSANKTCSGSRNALENGGKIAKKTSGYDLKINFG